MEHPLKVYRVKRGISQDALGAELGVSGIAVFRWESGGRKIKQSRLADISEKTGIAAEKLRPDLAAIFDGASN